MLNVTVDVGMQCLKGGANHLNVIHEPENRDNSFQNCSMSQALLVGLTMTKPSLMLWVTSSHLPVMPR